MDPEKPDQTRTQPLSRKALAMVAMLVLIFGGGWASLAPNGGLGLSTKGAGIAIATLSRSLEPSAMAQGSADDAAASTGAIVRNARIAGIDPAEILAAAFPPPSAILGMLSLDRDIDDFLDYAERDDAAGDYYRAEAQAAREMRPLRPRYEAAFAAASAALRGTEAASPDEAARAPAQSADLVAAAAKGRKRPYIASPGEVWLPPKSELPLSHPYALDIFFYSVERSGEAERGPVLHALYPGIVVASASDWSGGRGISKWKGGGLSPASGNGLVIFDPSTRRYCSYFHMSSVGPRTGDWVEAGEALGRGGNTGMNARMKGHGEHVHIEIFDSARGESLSAYELLELLKRQ